MRKTWVLIGCLLLLVLLLLPVALLQKTPIHLPSGGAPTPTPVNAGTQSSPSGFQIEVSPEESPTPVVTPSGDTVTISNIPVKNFYQTTTPVNSQGDRDIVNVENAYSVTFLAQFQQFLISITGSPFDTYRQQAEAAFLQKLNISQSEACKLDVVISTPRFANPNEAGQDYPLSFCQ